MPNCVSTLLRTWADHPHTEIEGRSLVDFEGSQLSLIAKSSKGFTLNQKHRPPSLYRLQTPHLFYYGSPTPNSGNFPPTS